MPDVWQSKGVQNGTACMRQVRKGRVLRRAMLSKVRPVIVERRGR